ncbi:hypothetical protein [Hoeflea sp.]|uniref:hypothetical protein n=1 Tax=Hoeflea sp. TaxID=1940281 RepID=UPI003B019D83
MDVAKLCVPSATHDPVRRLNRHGRRRQAALQRREDQPAKQKIRLFRRAMLASGTALAAAIAPVYAVNAQVILNPPGTVPAQCTFFGGVSICEGDLSAGLDANGPPLNELTVRNLTSAITPTGNNNEGIKFDIAGNGNAVLEADLDLFGITTDGNASEGIMVEIGNNGNIVVNKTGSITTKQPSSTGIETTILGNGGITIVNDGPITTEEVQSEAIEARVSGNGNIDITSNGPLVTQGRFNSGGIDVLLGGNGNVSVTANDIITTRGDLSDGIGTRIESATTPGTSTITIVANGAINTSTGKGSKGIEAQIFGDGDISVTANASVSTFGASEPPDNSEAINTLITGNGNIAITACAFRPIRPPVPVYCGHRIRLIAATSASGIVDGAINPSGWVS